MPVSYTFETDVMWVSLAGRPTYKQFVKTMLAAFKDRRFIPGGTGIIYDATTVDPNYSFSEIEHKKVSAFMVANSVTRIASIVADLRRCRAACEFREFVEQSGGEHGVFCNVPDAIRWLQYVEDVQQCDYDSCRGVPAKPCLCKGQSTIPCFQNRIAG